MVLKDMKGYMKTKKTSGGTATVLPAYDYGVGNNI